MGSVAMGESLIENQGLSLSAMDRARIRKFRVRANLGSGYK